MVESEERAVHLPAPESYLVFSDQNTNVIYTYKPESGNLEIYRTKVANPELTSTSILNPVRTD